MNIFRAISEYDGEECLFDQQTDAEKWAENKKEDLHHFYCVERKLNPPSDCLCRTSKGKRECAAHTYQRTVTTHEIDDCPMAQDVKVEEIEVN